LGTANSINYFIDLNTIMTDLKSLPLEVRQLLCPSGRGGQMETAPSAAWNLGFSSKTREDDSGDDEDEDSVNSTGSCITLESHSPTIVTLNSTPASCTTTATTVTPSSPLPVSNIEPTLVETPPEERSKKRR
jgi:hypothetical protein